MGNPPCGARGDRRDEGSTTVADAVATPPPTRSAGSPTQPRTRAAAVADEAVAGELAAARIYSFASADYPGAAQSLIFDSDGTTAVGVFTFDPSSAASPLTAFTFGAGGYQIISVPSSTASVATGIDEGGVIVGAYTDLAGKRHGFVDDGGTFTDVDVPGAGTTQVIGVDAG